jgi:hypothetical protein
VPLYIKDETTTQLVNQLDKLRRLTKQDAVRLGVVAELKRAADSVPLCARIAEGHPINRIDEPMPRRFEFEAQDHGYGIDH